MILPERLENIERLLLEIEGFESLKPCDEVNRCFSELVTLVVGNDSRSSNFDGLHRLPVNIPVKSFCEKLGDKARAVASQAESEMEIYWASKILSSENPFQTLQEFPYVQNYQELVHRELALVQKSGRQLTDQDNVLIVGTGPLPMTALAISEQTGASVDQVDSSAVAIRLCAEISETLGLKGKCILGRGQDVALEKQYSMVLIAGLAGVCVEDKQEIVDRVKDNVTGDGRIVMRGAHGLRELLYPSFDPSSVSGIDLLETHHPQDHVINSVFVYDPNVVAAQKVKVSQSALTL